MKGIWRGNITEKLRTFVKLFISLFCCCKDCKNLLLTLSILFFFSFSLFFVCNLSVEWETMSEWVCAWERGANEKQFLWEGKDQGAAQIKKREKKGEKTQPEEASSKDSLGFLQVYMLSLLLHMRCELKQARFEKGEPQKGICSVLFLGFILFFSVGRKKLNNIKVR